MSKKENLHEGHRARMRSRYLDAGSIGFSDHGLLELLLYYAIPRANTNETAHLLLDCFGSLEGVINADVAALSAIEGIGDTSALLLTLMGETLRRIARQSCETPRSFDRTDVIVKYLQHRFVGETTEKVYLLLFDNGMKMLDAVCLGEGAVNAVYLQPRTIMEHAMACRASAVLMAHNHPGGIAIPSEEDIEATYRIKAMLASVDITLLEHLVFAGDRYLPILEELPQQPVIHTEPRVVEQPFYSEYLKRQGALSK